MKTINKYIVLAAVAIWAMASLFLLCGEADIPFVELAVIKAAALASLWFCYKAVRRAERNGLMPDFWYKLTKEA